MIQSFVVDMGNCCCKEEENKVLRDARGAPPRHPGGAGGGGGGGQSFGGGKALGGTRAPDGVSARDAAAAAAMARHTQSSSGGGGQMSEADVRLKERRAKDELVGKIEATYKARGQDPPFGLASSSIDVLKKVGQNSRHAYFIIWVKPRD